MSDSSAITVHLDVDGVTVVAGLAYVTVGRQRVSTSFHYDPAYLAAAQGADLEPALPRQSGQQYVVGLPGCLQDSAPDRWGRTLIDRARRAEQRAAGRRLATATPVDYLLGVSDLTRQGDLRLSVDSGGPFLAEGEDVPKLIRLPELLSAADAASADPDDLNAVKALLDAGSGSLGGARPKASVRDGDGRLLIAKFPHREDDWDVMAWEATALDLAEAAGIRVPSRSLVTVGARRVLLLRRFDRTDDDRRVGYLSAMSLLGARDGEERDYVDVAEALADAGASVLDDVRELFRRVVFSVALHNTDDHLRNLGFLRGRGGWRLSPAFDVNPEPDGARGRVTSIAGAVAPDDEVEGLHALAPVCRLREDQAGSVVSEVVAAVVGWRAAAARRGIAEGEVARFADSIEGRLSALKTLLPA